MESVEIEEAMDACKSILLGDRKTDAFTQAAIASITIRHRLVDLGEFDWSESFLYEIATRSPSKGDLRLLRHRHYLGLAALRRRDLKTAAWWFERASDRIAQFAPGRSSMSEQWAAIYDSELHLSHIGWGRYHLARGAIDEAYRSLEPAREAFERAMATGSETLRRNRPFTQALFEVDLALAAAQYQVALDKADTALTHLDSSIAQHRVNRLARRRAIALSELALMGRCSSSAAIDALLRVLSLEGLSAADKLDTRFRLCQAWVTAGDLERAHEIAERVPRRRLGGLDRALAVAMLLDSGRGALDEGLYLDLRNQLAEVRRGWMAVPPVPGGTGTLHFDKVHYVLRVAIEAELRHDGDRGDAALDVLLRAFDAHDLARRLGAGPVAAKELRRVLLDGEVALAFAPSDRGGFGFLVTRGSVQVFPIGATELIKETAGRLRGMLLDHAQGLDVQDWRPLAATLGERLLPAEISHALAGARTVIVFGSDLIFEAPLGLVTIEGQPLALRSALAHVPTPAILVHLRRRVSPTGSGAAIIANVPSESWMDPRETRFPTVALQPEDLERWKGLLGGECESRTGEQGSVQSLLGGALSGRALGVIFAHGDMVPDRERPSGLLLGGPGGEFGDGRLSSRDAESMRVADMMVLATCRAGRGPERIGAGGSNHLGGALMLAGSRTVVLSQNDLAARAAAILTEELLRRLGRGETAGSAHLGAKQRMAEIPAFAHPSTWAALDLFGLPEVRVREPGPGPRWLLWALAACGSGAGLLLLARRR